MVGSAIRKAFGVFDTDGSGSIDFDEALKVFGKFKGMGAKKMLMDMDDNGDKKIDVCLKSGVSCLKLNIKKHSQ